MGTELRRSQLRVVLPLEVYVQLRGYVDQCPTEVSGVGEVEVVGNCLIVRDVFLLPQRCNAGYTELDPDAFAAFFSQWIMDGKDPARLRLWWHSHGLLPCAWSGRDDSHIAEYQRNTWWLSILFNHWNEVVARLDVFQPFVVTLNHLPVIVEVQDNAAVAERCREELEACVRPLAAIPSPTDGTGDGEKGGMTGDGPLAAVETPRTE